MIDPTANQMNLINVVCQITQLLFTSALSFKFKF